jgi:hypothetical protein
MTGMKLTMIHILSASASLRYGHVATNIYTKF